MSASLPDRRAFIRTAFATSGILLADRWCHRLVADAQPQGFRGAKPGDARTIDDVRFCWCPPGRFGMGSPPQEAGHRPDEAQVEVVLTRGFRMAKTTGA